AAAAAPRPKRLVVLGFGWGVTWESWGPAVDDVGPGYTLPAGLAPLARHKADFTVVQNLTNRRNDAGHWGSTLWLTNADRYAVPGSTFTNTVSVDQLAAEVLGTDTRYASVQLGCQKAEGSGHGPGLSLAWDRRGKPMAGWDTPFDAYARLFGDDGESAEQKRQLLADERSALDAVLSDAKALDRRLGKEDSDKLAEYLQSVRDIETRLTKEERWIGVEKPKGVIEPPAKNASGVDEINLMYDLIAAALATDQTRVITYRQPVESLLTSIGAKVAAHDMSHYAPGPQKETSEARDLKQSELLAGLFDRLKAAKAADGRTLFDDTIVVYGSNLRTGHGLDNCPTVLAGGGGAIRHSGHVVLPQKNTPLANLWLTLLHTMGVEAQSFADSTGEVREILPA
ncbi:MAG: DUF1552 domain-containing protein, partial [Pirellulales bacterium]